MAEARIPPIINKSRDIYLDAVKGFLILCIILEHNTLLTSEHAWIRPFCDAFAAGCFLIFTFTWQIKKTPIKEFINKNFSYWWPFFLFLSLLSILNFVIYQKANITTSIDYYVTALLISSPLDIKNSSGFMYLWFLPCLCFLYLLRYIAVKLHHWSYIISIFAWLTIGLIDDDILVSTPYSLHVIAFVFLLGQIYGRIQHVLLNKNNNLKYLLVLAFLILSISSYSIGWELFLAGGNIPAVNQPALLIFYSIFMLIAIPGIYHLLSFFPVIIVKSLAYIGGVSLMLYIFHPPIYIFITQILRIVENPIISFLMTLLISTAAAYVIQKLVPIHSFMFPNTLNALMPKRKI